MVDVLVTTARGIEEDLCKFDDSYSGAQLDEAVSYGKIKASALSLDVFWVSTSSHSLRKTFAESFAVNIEGFAAGTHRGSSNANSGSLSWQPRKRELLREARNQEFMYKQHTLQLPKNYLKCTERATEDSPPSICSP
ncbi:unnamed protein product [Malus baccata var. baccata]